MNLSHCLSQFYSSGRSRAQCSVYPLHLIQSPSADGACFLINQVSGPTSPTPCLQICILSSAKLTKCLFPLKLFTVRMKSELPTTMYEITVTYPRPTHSLTHLSMPFAYGSVHTPISSVLPCMCTCCFFCPQLPSSLIGLANSDALFKIQRKQCVIQEVFPRPAGVQPLPLFTIALCAWLHHNTLTELCTGFCVLSSLNYNLSK